MRVKRARDHNFTHSSSRVTLVGGRGEAPEKCRAHQRLLMSATSSSDSASSAAARRSGSYGTRPPSRLSVRHDVPPEGAGDISTTAAVVDELTDVHAGDKRERSPEVAVGDGSAATASGDRHLADDPHEGAVPPLRPCRALTASSYLHSQPVIC